MTLGEALSLRARQAQKLADLSTRIRSSATYQEGDTPAENPNVLIQEYTDLSATHADLVEQISTFNTTATDENGVSLNSLLRKRDHLVRKRNIYRTAADAVAGANGFRYGRNEIRSLSALDVPQLRASENQVAEEIFTLDSKIQKINFTTEL